MGEVISFFRPASTTQGAWSPQELAEFYRVEDALIRAGMRITSEQGLSDEADPWFVFCRPDGDAIMHFARIDGSYVVASEVLDHTMRGGDFRTLLDEIAAQNPELLPIRRRGAGTTFAVHPAALLAALVAAAALTLYSEDAFAGDLDTTGRITLVPVSPIVGGGHATQIEVPLQQASRSGSDASSSDGQRRQIEAVLFAAMMFVAQAAAAEELDQPQDPALFATEPGHSLASQATQGDMPSPLACAAGSARVEAGAIQASVFGMDAEPRRSGGGIPSNSERAGVTPAKQAEPELEGPDPLKLAGAHRQSQTDPDGASAPHRREAHSKPATASHSPADPPPAEAGGGDGAAEARIEAKRGGDTPSSSESLSSQDKSGSGKKADTNTAAEASHVPSGQATKASDLADTSGTTAESSHAPTGQAKKWADVADTSSTPVAVSLVPPGQATKAQDVADTSSPAVAVSHAPPGQATKAPDAAATSSITAEASHVPPGQVMQPADAVATSTTAVAVSHVPPGQVMQPADAADTSSTAVAASLVPPGQATKAPDAADTSSMTVAVSLAPPGQATKATDAAATSSITAEASHVPLGPATKAPDVADTSSTAAEASHAPPSQATKAPDVGDTSSTAAEASHVPPGQVMQPADAANTSSTAVAVSHVPPGQVMQPADAADTSSTSVAVSHVPPGQVMQPADAADTSSTSVAVSHVPPGQVMQPADAADTSSTAVAASLVPPGQATKALDAAETSSITAEASHVPPSQVMQPANGADTSGTTKLTGVEEHATQTEPRSPTSGEAVPQSESTEASDLSQTKAEGATENGRAADMLHQVPETAPGKSADIAVSHSAAHSTNALPQIAVQPPQTNTTAPALATIDADGNLVFGAGAGHSSPLPPGNPVPSPYPQEADQNSGVGLVGIASLHNPLHHPEIH